MNVQVTDTFINRLYNMTKEPIPDRVMLDAKKRLLDYLGVTLAGWTIQKKGSQAYLGFFKEAAADATVVGSGKKTGIFNAVLINGMNSHVAELDDGHRIGMVHPGSTVISALLPMSEYENVMGKDLLTGIVIGYEAMIRLACAIQPVHRNKGHHATGTCGTIGAAMAVSAALRFSKEQMKDALSAAIGSASGLLEMIEDGSQLKPYNVARASVNGLIAAYMGRAGFAGPDDALGGRRGFLSVMSDKVDLHYLTEDSHASYRIEEVYLKQYAACRHCHPAIEAAIRIREKNHVDANLIREIKVKTYHAAIRGHDHTDIKGVGSAKMSIPYCVAASLVLGNANIDAFLKNSIRNPDIKLLMSKVSIVSDNELSTLVPQKRVAIVSVTTKTSCYTERVDYPKGEPENPLLFDELKEKFYSLAVFANRKEEAKKIIDTVFQIESDMNNLYPLL